MVRNCVTTTQGRKRKRSSGVDASQEMLESRVEMPHAGKMPSMLMCAKLLLQS